MNTFDTFEYINQYVIWKRWWATQKVTEGKIVLHILLFIPVCIIQYEKGI